MKEVKALVTKYKSREERDWARAQLARKVLGELLYAASSQVGPQRWINEGGLEAQEFLEALDEGRWHPLLKQWQQRRRTAPHRRAASARERQAQRFICLAVVALERMFSLGPGEAREEVAKKSARVFDRPPTAKMIEHWQDEQPLRSAADEQFLAEIITRSRPHEPGGRERLLDNFIGLAHAVLTPGTTLIDTDGSE
jgi:hypothetical protein